MSLQTVTKMEQELNRWLRVQWAKADFIRSLPTIETVCERVRSIIESILKDIRVFELDIPEDCANVPSEVLTMLTVSANLKSNVIAISSVKSGHTMDLVWINTVTEQLDVDGDACNAVKTVSIEYARHDKITEMLSDAVRFASYLPIQQVWEQAPKDFKRQNPICPRCGGLLEALDLNDSAFYWSKHPRYRYVCHNCSYESHVSSGAEYDLAEKFVENFGKELKRVETEDKTCKKAELIVEEMDALIYRLESLHRNTPHYAFGDCRYKAALEKIQKHVNEAMQKANFPAK